VIVIVAKAAAPVPMEPRSQSSVPPVIEPTITHDPRSVVNPTYVKFEGGVSIMRTNCAPTAPTFRTSMVYVNTSPVTTGSAESIFVTVRSGSVGVGVGVSCANAGVNPRSAKRNMTVPATTRRTACTANVFVSLNV